MLAEYYTRCSLFEKAYDVYEEAISTITTVRDFTIVYDAYSQFLERMIEVKLELADEDEEEEANFENIFDIGSAMDLDLMSDRLDHLFNRREELLSSVKLRQNPHNIREWLNRVKIYLKRDDIEEASQVFATAVNTVDPFQCTGKYSTLWIDFAKFYENFAEKDDDHELEDSRDILKMAVKKQYKSYHDLANVWCEWVEMELRHRNYEEALKLIREAVHFPTPDQRMSDKMQDMLWKVERLWALRLDLEESLSNLKDVRQCYNDAMKLNVATVQNVLNFADTLWKNKYFEDAFRAYERGVHMFPYPHVMIIWKTYLKKFLGRHEDSGLERIRELFNQAILKSPPASKKDLYLMYAHLEEKRGLSRHVVRIYDEAVEKVSQEHQADMYRIYVKKVIELFGVTRAREIYEKAIQNLPDIFLPEFSLRYLKLECQLGEIDRARAIFIYGCQFANPTRYKDFWEEWKNFEVDNGNDETFREMLRMKRTIEAQNTNANVMGFISAGVQMGEDQSKKGEENSSGAKDAISELDAEMDERRAMVPDESKTE